MVFHTNDIKGNLNSPDNKILWRLHNSFPGDEEFYQQWNKLVDKQECPTIFMTPLWIKTWWEHFGSDKYLFLVTGTLDGNLIAFAPLLISRGVLPIPGFFKVLEFIGTSAVATRGMGLTDRIDFLYDNNQSGILFKLVEQIFSYRSRFDLVFLRALPKNSPSIAVLENSSRDFDYFVKKTFRSFSPYTSLNGTWEDFLASRKSKVRTNWRNSLHRLEKLGKPSFTAFPENDWSFEKMMQTIIGLNIQSYKWKNGTSLFQTGDLLKFYTDFFKTITLKGMFMAHFLLIDNEPIAYQLGYRFAHRFFGYNASYNAQYSKVSPGIHLVIHLIEKGFKEGMMEYDMMRGEETYKDNWALENREEIHFVAYNTSFKSRLAYFANVEIKEFFKQNQFMKKVYNFITQLDETETPAKSIRTGSSQNSGEDKPIMKLGYSESIHFWKQNDEIKKDFNRNKDPEGLTYGLYDDFPIFINRYYAYFQEKIVRRFLKQIPFSQNYMIAEIGCGSGRWSRIISRLPHRKLFGLDIAFNFLKKNLKIYGDTVYFLNALASELPMKPETFNVVYSVAVLHHLPDHVQHSAVKEIHRILKPDGYFFFIESTEIQSTSNHLYAKKFEEWETLLKNNGFQIVDSSGQEYIDFRNIIRPIRQKLKIFSNYILKTNRGSSKNSINTMNSSNIAGEISDKLTVSGQIFHLLFYPLVLAAYPLESALLRFGNRSSAHYACILAKKVP